MKSFYLALALLLTLPAYGQIGTRKTFPYLDTGNAASLPVTCIAPSFYFATDTQHLYVCNVVVGAVGIYISAGSGAGGNTFGVPFSSFDAAIQAFALNPALGQVGVSGQVSGSGNVGVQGIQTGGGSGSGVFGLGEGNNSATFGGFFAAFANVTSGNPYVGTGQFGQLNLTVTGSIAQDVGANAGECKIYGGTVRSCSSYITAGNQDNAGGTGGVATNSYGYNVQQAMNLGTPGATINAAFHANDQGSGANNFGFLLEGVTHNEFGGGNSNVGGLNGTLFANASSGRTVQQTMTAASTNGLSEVTPTYAGSDVPSGTRISLFSNPLFAAQANGAHLLDYRYGGLSDFINNCGFQNLNNQWPCRQEITLWNQPLAGSFSTDFFAHVIQNNYLSGTQNINQNGYVHKSNGIALDVVQNSWSSMQSIASGSGCVAFGTGDCLATSISATSWGGSDANSDEGVELLDGSVSPGWIQPAGTIASGGASGATSLTLTYSQGSGKQGVGNSLIDTTQSTAVGTVTSISGSGVSAVVTFSGTAFTTSTITTTSAAITVPASTTTTAAITSTGSQSIAVSSSTGYRVNTQVGITDSTPNNFELVTITAIADGTHVTANFTNTHASGATLRPITPGSVNIQVASSAGILANDVVGVFDSANADFVTVTAVPDGTHITANFTKPFASGATVSDGGIMGKGFELTADRYTASGATGFVVVTPPIRQVWYVIGCTSGTSCRIWISIAGTADNYAGNATFPGAAYTLYPMAIISDVTNGTSSYSNTITLKSNAVAWANSDAFAIVHFPTQKIGFGNIQINSYHPSQGLAGVRSGVTYNGTIGSLSGNDCLWCLTNNTPTNTNLYQFTGGNLIPPTAYRITGISRYALQADHFPTSAFLQVGCPYNTSGVSDCTLTSTTQWRIIQASTNAGSSYLAHEPSTGDWLFQIGACCNYVMGSNGQFKAPGYATSSNCAVNSVSPAACGSAASGAVVIPTTTTTYTINTTAVNAASRIQLTWLTFASNLPSSPTCVAPSTTTMPTISAISAGVSFTITMTSTAGQTCPMYDIKD